MSDPAPAPAPRPRRLSPLTPLVRSSLLVVAVLASTWDDLLSGRPGPVGWVLLVMLVAGAVYGTASWLRTTYWIEADELRVDTGVISRQSRRIRVDRLQGVDISQPFVARLLGLAELKMDVAGAGTREGSLAFLPLHEAQQLRAALLERRDAVRARTAPAAGPVPVARPVEQGRILATLDLGTLVTSLLLSPETVLFAFAGAALVVGLSVSGPMGGVAGVVPVVVGFALTQVRRLSAYYGFTVAETPAGLQVRRGLFSRDTSTISLARVQGVVVSEPLMWRGFGWARLDVALAGYSGSDDSDGRPSASTVMPVAPRPLVLWLARRLLAEAGSPDPDAVVLTPPPSRARWAAPVRRRFMAAGTGDHLVVSREGLLTRRTNVVPHARVQSLQVHQGPWQRRLGLADLRVDSPPGPVGVRARHRDAAQARALLLQENDVARAARAGRSAGTV